MTVPDHVLVAIAVRAAETVDGVRVRRRRTVDLERRHVALSVSARRGEPLVELAEQVQESVSGSFHAMCGIDTTVDVSVGALE